jgi:3-hydroxyisobutyrate dehydrogenase-like beta-hydroxyacid dehydrogenase
MSQTKIGILHPGNMGVSVAASFKAAGNEVCWASEGRSEATEQRALDAGLSDACSVRTLCETCSILVSICPPHAASVVADQVLGFGFEGCFLDANAISPQTSIALGSKIMAAGGSYVDGGIVGGPAWKPGNTWLYLSGSSARGMANILAGGPLEVAAIGSEPGKASALKMCYAAYTKGSSALLAAIVAAATHYGVREDLETQWAQDDPDFPERTNARVRRVTAKAWRFVGEMEEISATFQAAGLPAGFHDASAEIYRRMEGLEKQPEIPELDEVLSRLLKQGSGFEK